MAAEVFRIEVPIDVKDNTKPGVDSAQKKLTAFEKSQSKLMQKLDKMNATKWKVAIEAVDKVTGVISKIGSTVKGVAGRAWNVTVGVIDKVTAPVKSMIAKLGELLSIGTAVSTVLGGITVADALNASAAQQRAEIQLKTVLENVGAAEDVFDRIKKKAGEIQQNTIFGDESMIAGAAELSTYISDIDALEHGMELLSRYAAGMSEGAEVSMEQMVNYATQLGKALNGEDANFQGLNMKGFALSEEQEAILKSDLTSDLEKIQVLIDSIDESWGSMAEKFATADYARVVQFKNAWGDVKEVIGDKLWPSVGNLFKMLTTKIPGVQKLLERGADWLSAKIEKSIPVIDGWIDSGIAKLEEFADLAESVFESEEFQNADFLGKVSIAWDRLIAQPFSEWWDKTGRAWFADKMSKVGEGIGTGMSVGLLALLGIDIGDTVADGTSVGAAFIEGFRKGFDTESITEALKQWASDNKEIVIGVGAIVGFNLITSLAGKINSITSLFTNGSDGAGSAGGLLSSAVSSMTVNAAVVNINGSVSGSVGKKVSEIMSGSGTSGGTAGLLTSGGTTATGAGSTGTTAAGAGISGMALPIAAGVGAAISVAASYISSFKDMFRGLENSKDGNEKGAKTDYITAAVKYSLTTLGSAFGGIAGGGVGSAIANYAGDKIGGNLSDWTDEGGLFDQIKEKTKTFFSETIPEKWDGLWDMVGDFFTEQVPFTAGYLTGTVGKFLSDTWDSIESKYSEIRNEKIPELTEKAKKMFEELPGLVGGLIADAKNSAAEAIQNAKSAITSIPERLKDKTEEAKGWVGEKLESVKGWASNIGNSLGNTWDSIKSNFSAGYDAATGKSNDESFVDLAVQLGKALSGTSASSNASPNHKSGTLAAYAMGGILQTPHMAMVAEDGAEAIIPLSPSKRQRGLDLWQEAGQTLGVQPYEDGGIAGDTMPISTTTVEGGASNHFDIHIEVSPEFVIEARDAGFDGERLVSVVREHIREMADDIGDEIADRLARVFSNMPVKGTA